MPLLLPAVFVTYGANYLNTTVHLVDKNDDEVPFCGTIMAAYGEWFWGDEPKEVAFYKRQGIDVTVVTCKRCLRKKGKNG